MLKRNKWIVCLLILAFSVCLVAGCGTSTESETPAPADQVSELEGTIVLYHAGSLAIPFEALEKEFETLNPKVDVQRKSGGSTALSREIVDLGQEVDIFASADYEIIDSMIPDYTGWNALFSNNSMVIMYTDDSKYADEINKDNWYEVLLREDVDYGHSNPNDDPCGYRSVLCWQLAEIRYEEPGLYQKLSDACPEENIRPKSVELISLLETGALDYAFEYETVARQHAQANPIFKWVELPGKINLSELKHEEFYKQASLETAGSEPGETVTRVGAPIAYGITMPSAGKNTELALEFMEFFFDREQGLKILEANGQPIPDQIPVNGEGMPEDLKALLQ
jgi:molybdate/tungstate transport system substrate-binding protein